MITDILKIVLANHVESSLAAQSYRWNVEGNTSTKYSSLFGEAYQLYSTQIDKIGEYIRTESNATDYFTGSVELIRINKTVVAESIVGDNGDAMCGALFKLNETMIMNISEIHDIASKEKNFGLVRYCEDRLIDINQLNYKLLTINK